MSIAASMMNKQAALQALILATLDAHAGVSGFTDVTEMPEIKEVQAAADILAIMGDPVEYVRIAFLGEGPFDDDDLSPDESLNVPHAQFGVYIYFQFTAGTSPDIWNNMLEKTSAPLGLMQRLRTGAKSIDAGGERGHMSNYTDYLVNDEPVPLGDDRFAHYAQFFIEIT